jgi:sugar phosphate isomerase/epimerase
MFSIGVITDQVDMDFENALQFIRDLGVGCIEIHALWKKNIDELNDEGVERAHRLVHKYGMKVSVISSTLFLQCHLDEKGKEFGPIDDYFITIAGSYDFHIASLKRCIELCRIFETDKIRTFGFIEEKTLDEHVAIQKVAEKLHNPVEMVEKAGITLLLENCPHTYLQYGERTAQVIQTLSSAHFKALWDPANTLRAGGNPFPDDYRAIQGKIEHMHFKDLSLEGTPHMVPLGEGEIDYRSIVRNLLEDEYSGTLSLEPEYIDETGGRPEGVRRAYHGLSNILNEFGFRATS